MWVRATSKEASNSEYLKKVVDRQPGYSARTIKMKLLTNTYRIEEYLHR